MSEKKILKASRTLDIRFSEVDSMNIVWHGSYPLYFEDAREEFGRIYGLAYLDIYGAGYYAPLVEMNIRYLRPVTYGMKPVITITYVPTESAKLTFDYQITDPESGQVLVEAHTVQVFTDMKNELMWANPQFFEEWKKKWLE